MLEVLVTMYPRLSQVHQRRCPAGIRRPFPFPSLPPAVVVVVLEQNTPQGPRVLINHHKSFSRNPLHFMHAQCVLVPLSLSFLSKAIPATCDLPSYPPVILHASMASCGSKARSGHTYPPPSSGGFHRVEARAANQGRKTRNSILNSSSIHPSLPTTIRKN
ncbi:hypothetical protein VTJ04DRAFT_5555 [Mycothermus thermophilus]|uniref:uncharacterized protein n=1 Tax=Humicola insolens TaxID=85995 RepID=UPI0037441828